MPEAFHLYTMRQAIEEGFILDVVKNYTTYATYYRLVKAVEDDPNLPKKKAARALAKFMSLHPHNIEQKTEVMVEHFRQKVQGHLGGRAKAMVVTSSRLHAVRYMQAFERYIAENGYTDIRPLVAFSGTVKDPDTGLEYTEPGMNTGLREREADQREATAGALRLAGLPTVAGREQIPDRLRPAAAARHVRGQAAGWRAGRANVVAAEPEDSRQRKPVRFGFRQRSRGHLQSLQALLRRDQFAGKLRPAAIGEA